jgi:hypothetical protein
MRLLILDTYYSPFLQAFYAENPALGQKTYEEQWHALMRECFGTSDFYSTNLRQLGHEAVEIVTNSELSQRKWAEENGVAINDRVGWSLARAGRVIPWPRRATVSDWFYQVLGEQIQQYRPDVLYVQDMNSLRRGFLTQMKSFVKIVVGQIACPISESIDFREYDLIVSSLPHFVSRFQRDGIASEYLKLAFGSKVLARLGNQPASSYDAVFVGSLSAGHNKRIRFLETVVRSGALDVWGQNVNSLSENSPLRPRYHGEAWALEMYRVLRDAKIALNNHIDLAQGYANNMRLFEATGVGTLLLTDAKDNLTDMFEPGREVITYQSADDCVELINYYLEHDSERETIAVAGQQRTLAQHTYHRRMEELLPMLEKRLANAGASREFVSAAG